VEQVTGQRITLVLPVGDRHPVPPVIENLHLNHDTVNCRIPPEDYVIAAIRIKWRVRVREINRPIRNLRQNLKVVPVEKPVQRTPPPPRLEIKPSMTPEREKQNYQPSYGYATISHPRPIRWPSGLSGNYLF
jgi:hypothetical protein